MNNVIGWIVAGLVGALVFMGLSLVVPVIGMVAGFMFELVFTETFSLLVKYLGVEVSGWQLGAMLGFVGSFFRSATTVNK